MPKRTSYRCGLLLLGAFYLNPTLGATELNPNCGAAIRADEGLAALTLHDKIALTQSKLADWLSRRSNGLVSRKEREKPDTLFMIHSGIPSFLRSYSPKGVVFRRYFSSKETLSAFLKDPKLIAGGTPYKKRPLDNRAKQFESDTYEDLNGIFLTTPTQKPKAVGMLYDVWVDIRVDESVGMAVLPSDDNQYTTFLIPADRGFELPVTEVLGSSLDTP
ncbi:MAG: hypothetical protein R3A80_11500 [Bdellovibrionota bacterium]